MKKYISIGFDTGGNFWRPASSKRKVVKAKSVGFGDFICELSNIVNKGYDCNLFRLKHHPAEQELINLTKNPPMIEIEADHHKFDSLRDQAWDQKSFEEVTGRETINYFAEEYYMKFDVDKFVKVKDLPDKYITTQWIGASPKTLLPSGTRKQIEKEYGLPIVDHERLKCSAAEMAYIMANAEFHVGTDSGLAHFAHCVLPAERVHVYVPKGKLTAQSRAQMQLGGKVTET